MVDFDRITSLLLEPTTPASSDRECVKGFEHARGAVAPVALAARQFAENTRFDELADLLPGPVLEYIKKYEIYRELNEAKLNS